MPLPPKTEVFVVFSVTVINFYQFSRVLSSIGNWANLLKDSDGHAVL